MATGDQNDISGRIRALLPRWFPTVTPILDGLLAGPASALAFAYSLLSYARLQTRRATVSGGFVDMLAWDFFGPRFQRKRNEPDATFNARIGSEVFRPRATRAALTRALVDLTGNAPAIFEPARPGDAGGYGMAGGGYGCAGGYGSLLYPFQAFVTAYRPLGSGIPNVNGYGGGNGGYGVGAIEWADPSLIIGAVADADIYAAVDSVKPAATIIWTQIQTPLSAQNIVEQLTVGSLDLGAVCAPVVLSADFGAAAAGVIGSINLGTVP